MPKKFDSVKFQRGRRAEISKKIAKMSPEEIVTYFKSQTPPLPSKKQVKLQQSRPQMRPPILDWLRKFNVTEDKQLKLEYFFYTKTLDKALRVAAALENLNYEVEYDLCAYDKSSFLVTGRTTKIRMSDEIIVTWTKQMEEIAGRFDCEFDGWGTETDQDIN